MTDLEPAPVREEAKEPAKAWRNWGRYHSHGASRCPICNVTRNYVPGEVHGGCCRRWPSRDTAVTHATRFALAHIEYLGAYPEGETP